MPDDEPIESTATEADTPEAASEPAPLPEPESAIEHRPEGQPAQLIDPDQLGRPTTAVGSASVGLSVIPPEQEMRALAQMANTIAMAGLCPSAMRGKPNDVFLVLLTARDLGTAISTAIREFHVIEGRVTLSPKVKLAMVRSRPDLGRVQPAGDNDEESATWHSWRADGGGERVSSSFSWKDAQLAHLVDSRCTAYEHWKEDGRQGGRQSASCLCKSNWKTYPKRMLSWRALGYLLDDEYPEVGTGLYSPDEVGAVTDENGEPIPVTGVETLPGMKQAPSQRGGASGPTGGSDEDAPAAPDDIAELTARLDAARAHDAAKAELQAWWTEREIGKLADLPARKVGIVRARFSALERKHGYDVEPPPPASEGAEAPAEPERGPESENGASEPASDGTGDARDPAVCDGDVAGWLIERVGKMSAAEIKAAYREADEKVPDGGVATLRGLWARYEFERIGGKVLALTWPILVGLPVQEAA